MKNLKDISQLFSGNLSRWLIFIIWALFVTGYWLPRNWSFYGGNDWDLTYSMFEVARKSLLEFGQWPQFNPWMAFGSDLNANPQAGHVSIFFLPVLLFGTYYGYKLSILIAVILGCWGAFRWFRETGADEVISGTAAMLFVAAGYFSSHIFQAGHSNTLYLYLLPWLAFAFAKLRQKYHTGYLILATLVAAQMIAGGAPIVYIMAMGFLGLWVVGDFWVHRRSSLLLPLLLTVFGSIILCLWKILPGMDLWSQTPRLVKDESGINLLQWVQSLAGYPFRTGTWHAHYEYNLGFSIILLGILLYFRQHIIGLWKWAILFALLVWFCLGNSPDYINPWYWLNRFVSPFNSMRAPSRFGIIAVFALLTALVYVLRFSEERRFIYAILLAAVVSQGLAFRAEASFIQDTPQVAMPVSGNDHNSPRITRQKTEGNFGSIQNNIAVVNAYEPLNLSAVSDTLPEFISAGKISYFSPNKIEFTSPDSGITLNLRYSPDWKLFGPGEVIAAKGLLHISGAKGTRILYYSNPLFSKGLWLSLLILPFWLISHFVFRKRKT